MCVINTRRSTALCCAAGFIFFLLKKTPNKQTKPNLSVTSCSAQTATLLFITGLYELVDKILPLFFKGMKAHLREQKNHRYRPRFSQH